MPDLNSEIVNVGFTSTGPDAGGAATAANVKHTMDKENIHRNG